VNAPGMEFTPADNAGAVVTVGMTKKLFLGHP